MSAKNNHENEKMKMGPVLAHNEHVEHVAREILIHAAIISAVCTIIVMVIP